MKSTINCYQFINEIQSIRPDNFNRAELIALFDWFEQYEEDCNEQIEFDPIGICCEFTGYESLKDFHCEYDKEDYPNIESIQEHTIVIDVPNTNGFIIQNF